MVDVSGSDYHGAAAGDCLRLSQSQIQSKLGKCTEVEEFLHEMEVKTIEETSKHAKESKEQEQSENAEDEVS